MKVKNKYIFLIAFSFLLLIVAGAAVGTAANALLLCVTRPAGLVASSIISGGSIENI